jgi:chitinase
MMGFAAVVASVLRAVLLPALLLCPTAVSLHHRHRHFAPGFSVASYLPEWRYEGANWDEIARHSTHVILFSLEPSRDGGLLALDRLPRAELMADAVAAAAKHGAELLLCFGGNGRSNGFSAMVRSDAARARFVASATALVEKHGLHGIDYNWEYPG